jgi:hypothetical protein
MNFVRREILPWLMAIAIVASLMLALNLSVECLLFYDCKVVVPWLRPR